VPCRSGDSTEETPKASEGSVDGPSSIAKGARVVVFVDRDFRQATVLGLRGDRILYEETRLDRRTGKAIQAEASPDKAWVIGRPLDPPPTPGDVLVAHFRAKAWEACQVKEGELVVGGTTYLCTSLHRDAAHFESKDLVRPSPAVQAEFKAKFSKHHLRERFERARKGAGPPFRPDNWRPEVGMRVLSTYMTYSVGEVTKVDGASASVKLVFWGDKDVLSQSLYPIPTTPRDVVVGQFVLVLNPKRVKMWRVTALAADRLELIDENQDTIAVGRDRVVPLRR